MNNATGTEATQPAAIFRPGLLDRLKNNSGIRNDDAFAQLIGVSRSTLQRYRNGEEPSLRAVVNVARAFGLGIGEVVTEVHNAEAAAS